MAKEMSHFDDPTLNEYLDSALAPARRAEVERHLAGCGDCAARLDRMRALFASLDSLPDLPLERDLAPGVLYTLRQNAPGVSGLKLRFPLRILFLAQTLLALVLLAAAVPFAARWLQIPDLAQLTSEATTTFSNVYSSALVEWNAALAEAGRFLTTDLAPRPDLPLPALPSVGLTLILLAAGILWLVGNGVLLRTALRTERR